MFVRIDINRTFWFRPARVFTCESLRKTHKTTK